MISSSLKKQKEEDNKNEMIALCLKEEAGNLIPMVLKKPIPNPGINEVLIKVEYAGICSTDIQIINGYKGYKLQEDFILGHEFVGTIVQVVSDDQDSIKYLNKPVVASINISLCNPKCSLCLLYPKGNHCESREVLGIYKKNGCFAQYLTIPISNCVLISEHLDIKKAVFCEPLAAAFQVVKQIEEFSTKLLASDSFLVVGDGKLGILIAQALLYQFPQYKIFLLGKHEEKLKKIKSFLSELNCEILDNFVENNQTKFAVVIEATGKPGGLNMAIQLVRSCGLIILKSTCAPLSSDSVALSPSCLSLESSNDIVVRELLIQGSRCGPFERAVEALESGKINVDFLIEKIFPIEQATSAIHAATQKGTFKVLLQM